jgi:penicillin-binding protein 1A
LAKNFLMSQGMYGPHDRSLRRKVQEVLMAFWLEWHFTKEQILTIYLNRVYFGASTWGIEAAARKYYHKSAKNLTIFEAATIAGLLKAPSRFSPAHHPERSRARAKVVLSLMKEIGYINDVEEHLRTLAAPEAMLETLKRESGAKFFADWVYDTLSSHVSVDDKDLVVITTFDMDMQRKAEEGIFKVFGEFSKEYKASEISMVAMTPDGAVKAMIGGTSYGKSQFNRVTQALRQPGSTFKPFVYLAALEAGRTPSSTVSDSGITIGNWTPNNFRNYKYEGSITLERALAKSVNTATARLASEVGTARIANVARRLGITTDMITDFSIALGSTEVTLLDLTAAYATFANQGNSVWPYAIVEIRDKQGNILYQRKPEPPSAVVAPHHVAQMKQMLTAVIEKGTGSRAKMKFPVAGKTGSNRDQDAWFVGFTSDLVAGVWLGNDDNKPMIKNSVGGRLPAMAWASFIKLVYEDHEPVAAATEAVADGSETPEESLQDVAKAAVDESEMAAFDPADAEIEEPHDDAPGPDQSDMDSLLKESAED